MTPISRRVFLRGASLTVGAAAVIPQSVLAQVAGANEAIRIAVVGVGGKGADHVATFKKLPDARIVALCDADRSVLAAAKGKLEKEGIRADGYLDLRKLLERNDIDAVVTATPNHWHALVTVWSCQAGKDVYVEKPVSHEIWEGRKMIEAARKYHRIVQAGTQSRTDPALAEAFAYVRAGSLGRMKLVRGFCYKRRKSIGKVQEAQPIPATVDYNLWSGPAPTAPLMRKSLHYDWHWAWLTGNGDIGNQGIHEMDMCRWAAGQAGLPPRVACLGGRFGYVDDGETPNTQLAYFDYQPVPILFEVRGLPMAREEEGESMDNFKGVRVGVVIECEDGYFAGGAGGGSVFDRNGKKIKQFAGPGGRDHQANFLKAVRSRKVSDLNADIEVCHLSSALCHMANISFRTGQAQRREEILERIKGQPPLAEGFGRCVEHLKANQVDISGPAATLGAALTMDAPREQFTGEFAEKANAWLKREYRKPFEIPDQV